MQLGKEQRAEGKIAPRDLLLAGKILPAALPAGMPGRGPAVLWAGKRQSERG